MSYAKRLSSHILRGAIIALAGLALSGLLSWTAQAAPGVKPADWTWDTPEAPRPRASWMNGRIFMICMPYETPYTEGGAALKPWAKRLQDAGYTLIAMYPDGLCRLYEPKPGEGDWKEACRREVEICHRLGIKVMAGIYPFVGSRGPRDLLEQHPEYRLVKPGVPYDQLGCLVQPGFSKAVIELLASRAREFHVDGYQFDGWYQATYCACDGCKQLYKEQTGLDVPGKPDPADLAFRKYNRWRDAILLQRLEELQTAVKAVNPDFILVNWNNNDANGSATSWMPEALNCVADWTNKEWWDAFDVYSVWLNKRLRGASGDERAPGMQPYMFMRWGKDIEANVYHGSSTPMEELLYRLHEIMTFGSIPITWSGARGGWVDADWERVVDDVIAYLPTVENTKSLKYAVCIDSYSTLQNAKVKTTYVGFHEGSGKEADDLVGYHRGGVARALLEAHVPFDVISEHNVTPEALAQYKVVILPNNFAMSERIAGVLRGYVQGGGGLVATHETSLLDELGQKRQDFALADLFGAHYVESEPIGPHRIDFTTDTQMVGDMDRLTYLMGKRGGTTYWGKFARVTAAEGTHAPLVCTDAKVEAAKNAEAEAAKGKDSRSAEQQEKDAKLAAKALKWTPLLLNEAGQGRVAYFPAAIDHAYYDAGYPYQRLLLTGAVDWAARGAKPPVAVTAPMCVKAGFLTREGEGGGRTMFVHLLNDTHSTTGHGSAADKEFALREEVVPIGGVKVTFAGERPKRVSLVPGGAALEPAQAEGGWEVALPDLELHAVVVAEY